MLQDIRLFIDNLLQVNSIPDEANNSLQVSTNSNIKKIGFAVDASLEVFEQAKKSGCNLIITHHGVSYSDNLRYLTQVNHSRVKFLLENNIGVYCAHLPLDANPDFGNNVSLFKLFGLQKPIKFGIYSRVYLSLIGLLPKPIPLSEFSKIVDERLQTKSKVHNFGDKEIRSVAIMSGAGSMTLAEAIEHNVDLYLTGELNHNSLVMAKDASLNVIEAGHYHTEKHGLLALKEIISKKFKVETEFIEAKW